MAGGGKRRSLEKTQAEEPHHCSRWLGEEHNSLRTDSPTTRQLYFNLILGYSACWRNPLGAGDIGLLARNNWHCSRFGLQTASSWRYCSRRFFILLASTCRKMSLWNPWCSKRFLEGTSSNIARLWNTSLELEQSAYYLLGPEGEVAGLLRAHVDDLLWSGTSEMTQVMENVQKKYNFASASGSEFRFCVKVTHQTPDGIEITCPNVMDRVKPIYMDPLRRKGRSAFALPHMRFMRSRKSDQWWVAWLGCPGFASQTWLFESTNFKQLSRQLEYNIWSKQASWLWLRRKKAPSTWPNHFGVKKLCFCRWMMPPMRQALRRWGL